MRGDAGQEYSYAEICESIEDVVYVVDADLELAFVNHRFVDASGVAREELLGTPIRRFAEGTSRDGAATERFLDALEAVLAGEREEARVDVPAHTGPLGDHVVETRLTPYAPDGEVTGVVGVGRDVTRRDSYEQELESRTEELAVLNRLLRHDVRNDMAIVDGWLGELAERVDGEDRELIDRVQRAARNTIDLTENARDYARIVTGGTEPELEPVDLAAVLRSELNRHREFAPEATFAVEGDLPAVEVRADEMLRSVFTNLLRNAVQHSDRDHPAVTVSADAGEETATVGIADDGPGFPPYLLDDTSDDAGASLDSRDASLGLYLVCRLVSAYGGDVRLANGDPRGAVVTVELPRADGEPSA